MGEQAQRSWSRSERSVGSGAMLSSLGLRGFVCVLAGVLATCTTPSHHTAATTDVASASEGAANATSPTPPPRVFDPDVVRPSPDAPIGQALLALSRHDPARAEAIAVDAMERAPGEERARLAWLRARAAREAGAPARAFEALEALASSEHPLAPWARLRRAQILIATDAAAAAEEVAPLTGLAFGGQREARDLEAAALVSSGRPDDAEPLLRALLAEAPDDSARASVAIPLAEVLGARDDVESKIEAIHLLRRVAVRVPLSGAGRDAELRIAALLAALPTERRREVREPTPEEGLERAEALASGMQQREAEEAFAEVAARTRDVTLRCRARYGQGRAIYYRRERRRAAEHLSTVARECEDVEVRAWSHFLAGKGFSSAGEPGLAQQQYALLEEQTPQHSLADDARYRSALLDGERGDDAAMVDKLTTLPDAYPGGDMHGHARFMLAWRARREGELDEALRQLDATVAEGAQEDREDLNGRAMYWRGCVLSEMNRADEARQSWTSVVESAPLSYYAQQSLVRLGEASPAAAETARATFGTRGDPHIVFAWRDELDTPAFARALELLAVGEATEAQRELALVREGSTQRDDEMRWIEAALFDRAAAYPEAVYLTRRLLREFMDSPPTGAHFARWRIAYPRAYAGAIERAAAEQPVPAALIFAIAREESSFRAEAVSIANAYGLTQLIVPTGRRFGRPLGITVNTDTLRDPDVNVRVGAAYMSWLWERYLDNPVVLPSAYNAGQGATDRWLRERPSQRLDEWVEDIPYDETRRYTRRVIQSWGIYGWLDRGELPTLGARLPQR